MAETRKALVVGIGGTLRSGSSGERLARAVLCECEQLGAQTIMFPGGYLSELPHFSPESKARTAGERALVDAVRACDGLVIASPGYHGGMSGLVKNAIDLVEDLRDDPRRYFEGRAVGLIVVAAGWQACGTTLSAMRDVVHALRGWPTPVGITVNTVAQDVFDRDGGVADAGLAATITAQARQIMQFAIAPPAA